MPNGKFQLKIDPKTGKLIMPSVEKPITEGLILPGGLPLQSPVFMPDYTKLTVPPFQLPRVEEPKEKLPKVEKPKEELPKEKIQSLETLAPSSVSLTPPQQKAIEEAQVKLKEMMGKLETLKTAVEKLKTPTFPSEISAASMGKVIETETKTLDDVFSKFATELETMKNLLTGDMSRIMELHQSELAARKAAIERQYLEQRQALEAAEKQAGEQIERGWERLGLRNIIIGRQLEDLSNEEARVAAEFSKAYSMLDAMKEEALTQATATQRAEDWNRLSAILNTKMNLLSQQMNLWQTYQNAKLSLRQQLLSEFVTRQQLEEARRARAVSDLEILLKPYVGRGLTWGQIPEDVRISIRNLEEEMGLPVESIAKQLIANPELEMKASGNRVVVWDKATGKIIHDIIKPPTPTAFEKRLTLNSIIDKAGEEALKVMKEQRPDYFDEYGRFINSYAFKVFIEKVAQATTASYAEVLSRFDPDIYLSPKDKDFHNIKAEFEKYLKIYTPGDADMLLQQIWEKIDESSQSP